ncbi:MAG: type II toxin-antitoxin system RelE/ParE family toxin [Candidatus Liptonbacteria bacterium]|nr:type II toxin-antitoxin system RelE/ParE family toxin [Candidatus Liptonbacteria bacterium]
MKLQILNEVNDFLENLPENDAGKILAHLKSFEENLTEGLVIKALKGKIKEIIIKQYRIIFFTISEKIYVVDAFKKQSQKTPKRIIERAEKIYKNIK